VSKPKGSTQEKIGGRGRGKKRGRDGGGRREPMLGNPAHLTCLAKPPWPAGFRVVSELA